MPCGINLGRVKRGSGTHLHFMPRGFRAGLQTAGRTPGKSNVVLRGGYPSETSLSLTITLSDFPFTPSGHVLRGGCTMAAAGSGEFWNGFLLWPKVLDCWKTSWGCAGKALWQGGHLPQLPGFSRDEGEYEGDYRFLWGTSLHGCSLSRGTKGLSCSQLRQRALNSDLVWICIAIAASDPTAFLGLH